MRKSLLCCLLFLIPVLASCGNLSGTESDVTLAPQGVGCDNIVPANAHKSRFSKPPYTQIGGKGSATCKHASSSPTTLSVWVTIDEKIGISHRVVARQSPVYINFTRYGQFVTLTQDNLRVFMKCRNGTFRTTVNFASSKRIQVAPHHSGRWIPISRCGVQG